MLSVGSHAAAAVCTVHGASACGMERGGAAPGGRRRAAAAVVPALPPRIALPDGEGPRSREQRLQLRAAYQQAELTRSAPRPPPNKSVADAPDWPARRPPPSLCPKKDGFVQKAVRYLARMGGTVATCPLSEECEERLRPPPAPSPPLPPDAASPGSEAAVAPCVMVPLPPPPAQPPAQPSEPWPSSPPEPYRHPPG